MIFSLPPSLSPSEDCKSHTVVINNRNRSFDHIMRVFWLSRAFLPRFDRLAPCFLGWLLSGAIISTPLPLAHADLGNVTSNQNSKNHDIYKETSAIYTTDWNTIVTSKLFKKTKFIRQLFHYRNDRTTPNWLRDHPTKMIVLESPAALLGGWIIRICYFAPAKEPHDIGNITFKTNSKNTEHNLYTTRSTVGLGLTTKSLVSKN